MKYDFNEVNNYCQKQVFTSQQQFNVAFDQFEAIYLAYNEVEHGTGSLTEFPILNIIEVIEPSDD